jgi:RNA polymerase sigma-70 factor (ECF subfamily)
MLELTHESTQRTDAELIHSIAQRDEAALAALHSRYSAILLGLIIRILNNRAEAEDVLQEVFLQVWQQSADFDQERGRAFTWLATRAHSRAIDRLRSLKSRDRVAQEASIETPVRTQSAFGHVWNAEQGQEIRRALAELPAKQRHVLLLAYFEGLSQSEIASRLGEPIGTVKGRSRQGLMRLRQLISEKFWKSD